MWQSEGLVDDHQVDAILDVYHASRRFSLTRLMLGLGAGFVGVGLIWLVAANLDAALARWPASPRGGPAGWRFLVGGEYLPRARASRPVVVGARPAAGRARPSAPSSSRPPSRSRCRPTSPRLIGLWALGALSTPTLSARRSCRSWSASPASPLVRLQPLWDEPGRARRRAGLAPGAVVAAALGASCTTGGSTGSRRPGARSARCSRSAALFVAALPDVGGDDLSWTTLARGRARRCADGPRDRPSSARGRRPLEPLGAVAVAAASPRRWSCWDDRRPTPTGRRRPTGRTPRSASRPTCCSPSASPRSAPCATAGG